MTQRVLGMEHLVRNRKRMERRKSHFGNSDECRND